MRRPNRKPNYSETGDIVNWSESTDYVIHKEGDDYIAVNGETGVEDSRSTNPSTAIQYALDNLTSGKIVVNTDLTQTVALTAVDDVILDFTNHLVTLSGDIDFLTMTQKEYFHLRNVKITVPAGHTSTIIQLNASTGTCRYNTFENIVTRHTANEHNYNGIELNITGAAGNIFMNTFRNIVFHNIGTGIKFDLDNVSAWCNGNLFEQVFINGYVIMVDFDSIAEATGGINRNTFIDTGGQTGTYSTDGYLNVRHGGNYFVNCTVWDWSNALAPNYAWAIHADSTDSYIQTGNAITDISDSGTTTILGFVNAGLNFSYLNRATTRNMHLFKDTTGNPYLYIYGDDHGDEKYGRMFINSAGTLELKHVNGGGHVQLEDGGSVLLTPGSGEYVCIPSVKTTTGDPTARDGLIYINTFDNKIRMRAGGGWRDLATW